MTTKTRKQAAGEAKLIAKAAEIEKLREAVADYHGHNKPPQYTDTERLDVLDWVTDISCTIPDGWRINGGPYFPTARQAIDHFKAN